MNHHAPHAERRLLDAAARLRGRSAPRLHALVLHLSRLPPPGVQPHHVRIARTVLEAAALQDGGEVFALRNADLVLLRRLASGALPAVLARLFSAELPAAQLLSEPDGPALHAYAAARLADPALPAADAPAPPADAAALVERMVAANLPRSQTAVRLDGGVKPLFRELAFQAAHADPWLSRHVAPRLDARLLHALHREPPAWPLPLHLNLTVAGVLSEPFGPFAAACRAAGVAVGVEVPLLEACADPRGFALARDRLRQAGMAAVLDEVSHHALLLTAPMAWQPDLVKLQWHEAMPGAGPALQRALHALGPACVVLSHAGTEAALAWGLAQGIRRFQGQHVDAVLAAQRVRAPTGTTR